MKQDKWRSLLKKIIRIFFILILLGVCFTGFELFISRYWLTTTRYTISSNRIDHPFRVVQLTDLHDSEFGRDNKKLISRVRRENPDIILITGDLVNNKKGEDTSIATTLISGLTDIAPVYFSYGNQEVDLEENNQIDIKRLFTEAGAVVMDKDYQDITVNGQKIRLGGIYGYCMPARYANEVRSEDESVYLKDFQNTELYTIFMCHMPVSWLKYGSLYDWNIDCVFAGHTHGGQVRIPFVGGLWAPDQGWFPGEMCGVYTTEKEKWDNYMKDAEGWTENENLDGSYYKDYLLKTEYKPSSLVLSRGLGNTDKIPRFNNIPEIVVVDFLGDK